MNRNKYLAMGMLTASLATPTAPYAQPGECKVINAPFDILAEEGDSNFYSLDDFFEDSSGLTIRSVQANDLTVNVSSPTQILISGIPYSFVDTTNKKIDGTEKRKTSLELSLTNDNGDCIEAKIGVSVINTNLPPRAYLQFGPQDGVEVHDNRIYVAPRETPFVQLTVSDPDYNSIDVEVRKTVACGLDVSTLITQQTVFGDSEIVHFKLPSNTNKRANCGIIVEAFDGEESSSQTYIINIGKAPKVKEKKVKK